MVGEVRDSAHKVVEQAVEAGATAAALLGGFLSLRAAWVRAQLSQGRPLGVPATSVQTCFVVKSKP